MAEPKDKTCGCSWCEDTGIYGMMSDANGKIAPLYCRKCNSGKKKVKEKKS